MFRCAWAQLPTSLFEKISLHWPLFPCFSSMSSPREVLAFSLLVTVIEDSIFTLGGMRAKNSCFWYLQPCFMSPKLEKVCFAYKWYFCNSAAPSIYISKFIPVSNGVISVNTSQCRYQKVSIKSLTTKLNTLVLGT